MRPYARMAALAFATLAGLTASSPAPPADHQVAAPQVAAPRVTDPRPADSFRSARDFAEVAVPVRLRIPALHVNTALQKLGLQADGTVAVPGRTDVAGWYSGGARPGQAGPAVILGHVDSHTGPGIFLDLVHLKPGAAVEVDRADGSTVRFRVTGLSTVPKVQFPTDLVYAPTLDPTLRLVTCGGGFDRTRGSYRDNVIAFADQV